MVSSQGRLSHSPDRRQYVRWWTRNGPSRFHQREFYVVPTASPPRGQLTIALSKIKALANPMPVGHVAGGYTGEAVQRARPTMVLDHRSGAGHRCLRIGVAVRRPIVVLWPVPPEPFLVEGSLGDVFERAEHVELRRLVRQLFGLRFEIHGTLPGWRDRTILQTLCRRKGVPRPRTQIARFRECGNQWRYRRVDWRPRPESNRGARICSPLRSHSATRPRRSVTRGRLHRQGGGSRPLPPAGEWAMPFAVKIGTTGVVDQDSEPSVGLR